MDASLLRNMLVENAIYNCNISVSSKPKALRLMINELYEGSQLKRDQKLLIFTSMLARENITSSGIGNGRAIPHTVISHTDPVISHTISYERIGWFVSKNGIPFEALDGKPAHVIFCAVSTENNLPFIMSAAEKLLRSMPFYRSVLSADTNDELYFRIKKFIDEADKILNTAASEDIKSPSFFDFRRQTTIVNKLGLHARTTFIFIETANKFHSIINVRRVDCGEDDWADGKDVMQLLLLAATTGTTIEIAARGRDATQAVDALVQLVESGFEGYN